MTIKPVKIAVVGCGNISDIYLQNAATWDILDVVAVSDLDIGRAAEKAAKYGIARSISFERVLADPSIELILNLTIPSVHGSLALQALLAGKSVYNEKPLAVSRDDARQLLETARAQGLRVGSAPDTFMGAGLQTCRRLIDEGAIGQPVAAMGYMLSRGPEHWHPDPAFLFKTGAGPLFDMGPYYLTALISFFGPVRRVTSSARITMPERTIRSGSKAGTRIIVEEPTHIASVIDFANGVVVSLVISFDVWDNYLPSIEVNGTGGTLVVPDPNTFGGPVLLRNDQNEQGYSVPLAFGYSENSRCVGLADMAYAIRNDRPHRANGEVAYHVLDVMHSLLQASATGKHVEITSTCERSEPMPGSLVE